MKTICWLMLAMSAILWEQCATVKSKWDKHRAEYEKYDRPIEYASLENSLPPLAALPPLPAFPEMPDLSKLIPSFLKKENKNLPLAKKEPEVAHAGKKKIKKSPERKAKSNPIYRLRTRFTPKDDHNIHKASRFSYPVGFPDAKGYYVAQGFAVPNKNYGNMLHLGEDWNAVTGGNSDLGDPVYAVANGRVLSAKEEGHGWGKVIRLVHTLPDGNEVESIYAHLDRIDVRPGDLVRRGLVIGTIGNAGGLYLAHLHFEIRDYHGGELGGGYASELGLCLHPGEFIARHK